MSVLHNAVHFLRWRLIAVRYTGKLRTLISRGLLSNAGTRTAVAQALRLHGHSEGLKVSADQLALIQQLYRPRILHVTTSDHGHPFVNLFLPQDIGPDNPVVRLAFCAPVLDAADDFFGGRFVLDSIQVMYSWPSRGNLRESQMWHKDYGDTRSFHWIAYLNDVEDAEDGPFAFIDKADTKNIRRSVFIRRIPDAAFVRELGKGQIREFLGRAGESIFVDPAACYHSGSRCKNPRLAIFVTFNTDRPFVSPIQVVRENRAKLAAAARIVRPDLSDNYLHRLLQLR